MILHEYVYLCHEELHDINTNIKNKLVQLCLHKCSPETGIINKFIEITNISNNKFNPCGDQIIFDVYFRVENYIPKPNDIIEAKVDNVLNNSVVLSYPINNPKMRIITNSSSTLQPGYITLVQLKEIKYDKSSVLCLGFLI